MDNIERALFKGLSESSYACGGTIKTRSPDGDKASSSAVQFQAIDPVTIRWDSATSIEKLCLPVSGTELEQGSSSIAKLVAGTQPASFGYQGQDIIDETYRKASKLDTSAFSTNFCPYRCGIIDVIGQALLPKLPSSPQGILAELYKLNIYKAPSGFFKPHVDTPRSELQFGSLVVCLPCEHEGGQLTVRHQGHNTTFDWSGQSNDIKWAAFYSDCEHEVLEVTSGHRITLTYNLYMRRGLGEIAGHCETLDAQQLPIYKNAKDALAKADFMSDGGLLGKYCSHAYAHATKAAASALPSILKGSDMVAFEVFRSLGIKVLVRPVADHITKFLEEDELEDQPERLTLDTIGDSFTEPYNTGYEWGDCTTLPEIYDDYPSSLEKVTWTNAPLDNNKNMQFSFMRYGNQAECDYVYSFCALLFVIPPYHERAKLAKKHGYTLE